MPVSALTGKESEPPLTWICWKFSVERAAPRSAPATVPTPPRPKALAPDEIIRAATGSFGPQGLTVLTVPIPGTVARLSAQGLPVRGSVGRPRSQARWAGVGEM